MASERRHRIRGQLRRDALLEAAAEVAAEEGIGAVTHRRVTERAGVPLATVSYFFDSIDDLATEALRVFTATRTAELEALADALEAEKRSPGEIAEALAWAATSERTWTLAQFEAYMESARKPALRPAVAETLGALDQVTTAVLRMAGGADPERTASSFVALIDGIALRRLALDEPVDALALYRSLRALLIGYLIEQQGTAAMPAVEALLAATGPLNNPDDTDE